jgi:hypothetical protein
LNSCTHNLRNLQSVHNVYDLSNILKLERSQRGRIVAPAASTREILVTEAWDEEGRGSIKFKEFRQREKRCKTHGGESDFIHTQESA